VTPSVLAHLSRPLRLLCALALVLAARSAHAEEPAAFVARWLAAQNQGDFAAYQALYGEGFRGVRTSGSRAVTMDRAKWLEDRERMFRKPMVVEADEIRTRTVAEGVLVELRQTWASGEYKDVGKKTLLLVAVGDELRIAREELLTSERVLLPGQILEVVIPVRTAEEAERARARFQTLAELLRGVRSWPLRVSDTPPGVVAVACGAGDVGAMARTARALEPAAVARFVRAPATACPELEESEDPAETWEWPATAEARLGKRTLTVLVTPYTSTDHGDWGRSRRGYRLAAIYREASGEVLDTLDGESASDFSEIDGLTAAAKKIVLAEIYVDQPCDGTTRHAFKRLRRVTTIEPDPSAPASLRSRSKDTTLERGRCDDAAYRDWLREMNRAR
jgi:hypothetical protein